MPAALVGAHAALDRTVDTAYTRRRFSSEAERVAFLFERYETLAAPLAPNLGKLASRHKLKSRTAFHLGNSN